MAFSDPLSSDSATTSEPGPSHPAPSQDSLLRSSGSQACADASLSPPTPYAPVLPNFDLSQSTLTPTPAASPPSTSPPSVPFTPKAASCCESVHSARIHATARPSP